MANGIQKIIDENYNYSATSGEGTSLKINFTEADYGIKLVYDQIDTALADMGFSNVTHSVY